MPLYIRRLDEDDLRSHFDCGDEALNTYLARYAWQNQRRNRVGVTYVAVDEAQPNVVIGYSTVAVSSIPRASSIELRRLSPYADIPVVLLARLAVDRRFGGRRIGEALLIHAVNLALTLGESVGCRAVIVDAYPMAVSWYAKYGFRPIGGDPPQAATRKMFIDLRTVEKAKR